MLKQIGGIVGGAAGLVAGLFGLLYFFNWFVMLFGQPPIIENTALLNTFLGVSVVGCGASLVIIGLVLVATD